MPCKAMDKNHVAGCKGRRVGEGTGVAIKVDVDRGKKIASEFQIAAIPTM